MISKFFIFALLGLLYIGFPACKVAKKTASATSELKNLSEKEHNEFTYYFFNANKEKLLGNYELAESLFIKCLHIDSLNAAAMYELATIYNFRENKKSALSLSKKAATINPANVWYQLLYAQCLEEQKQYAELIPIYQQLTLNYPVKMEFYSALANAQLYVKKYNDALKTYDKMEEIMGVNEEVSFQKVRVYEKIGNKIKLQQELEKLIHSFPQEGKYYVMLGDYYRKNKQDEKAIQTYNELIKIDSNDPYVHLSLADYYRSIKQDDKSYNEVKLAFANERLDSDTKIQILLSYFAMSEKYPEYKIQTNELSKLLVNTHPQELKTNAIYAELLYKDKKLEESSKYYRKAITLDSSKYELWNQLLIIDSELNNLQAMLDESAEAIELFPNQAVPYLLNGMAHLQLKNYTKAIEVFDKGLIYVIDNKPMLGQFYSCLGDAYHKMDNLKASDSAYTKALEIEPKNVYVLNNYSYYLSLRVDKLEEAEKMSKKSNELEPNNDSYQDTYGWILYQMGKYAEAKIWIGKAMNSGGKENAIILEHYGDVLNKLGEVENALKYWKDALQRAPESESLKKKLAEK